MTRSATTLDPKSLSLDGTRLIEASAGTGKTWTIAALYLRLVLGIDCRALEPPNILVLTFTRAATQELRERIRQRLTEAAAAFRVGESKDEYLAWLLTCFSEKQFSGCARTLDIAAEWMDEAAIHTIHAWCQTMLRQHAFDSGSLFDQEVDSLDPALLHRAAADYWRDHFCIDHAFADALTGLAADPADLARGIRQLMQPDVLVVAGGQPLEEGTSPSEALDQLAEWQRQRDELLLPLREQWLAERDGVRAVLDEAVARGDLNRGRINAAKVADWCAVMDDWAAYGGVQPPELEKFRAGFVHALPNKDRPMPEHPWFDQVEQVLAKLEELGDAPDWQSGIWQHAAFHIGRRFLSEKQRHNRLDFNDLLTHLDEALDRPGGQRLKTRILESFPVALVDEFQDTDPVQYRVFERVWGECGSDTDQYADSGLLMIGDPKQAIYSFRGADIHTYLRARRATQHHYTLERNFRSSEALVEAVNHLFSCGEGHPEGAFAFGGDPEHSIPFEPVLAWGREEVLQVDGKKQPAMTVWYQSEAENSLNRPLGAYRQVMAEQAAAVIAELLNQAGTGQAGFARGDDWQSLQPADIAVLVRSRQDARMVRDALAECGVSSVFLSDRESVFDSEQARDLILMLQAVADPDDDRRLRAALGTRAMARTLGELDEINRHEDRLESLFDDFAIFHRIWRRQGVLAMLRRLLAHFDIPARVLASPADGERALTNLLHLAELLQAESQSLDGEQALIQWLAEQIDAEQRGEVDEQILRLESDAELVRVVTIHSSKGLEYPLVFAPFVCAYREEKDSDWLSYHDEQGRRVLDINGDDRARAAARRERIQEDLRLLYVAVTRARHACWLGAAPTRSGGGKKALPALEEHAFGHLLLGLAESTDQPPPMHELLDELADGCEEINIEPLTEAPVVRKLVEPATDTLEPAREYDGQPRRPWWIASYSAIRQVGAVPAIDVESAADDQALEESEVVPDERPVAPVTDSPHGFPRGPGPGTFLHGLLEWAGRYGMSNAVSEPEPFNEQIERRCRLRGWQRWAPVVQQWMHDQLTAQLPLGDKPLRLADLQTGQYTPELEFWFQASAVDTQALDRLVRRATFDGAERTRLAPGEINGMLRGFIDLVYEHEGRYYVLDYKSNHLGGNDAAYSDRNMTRVVLEKRYDLQFVLYTLALHRLLKSRLPDYDYRRHVGGSVYLFLRGVHSSTGGVFYQRPDTDLIEALDTLFAGGEGRDVA